MFKLILLFLHFVISETTHFNGGIIGWKPIYPYRNTTTVPITIIQKYSWTASSVTCATNVPISTPGRHNQNYNLTCMADCSTDGGYSLNPINILTDCETVTSSLNLMTSQRLVNVSLNAGAHFYVSNVGAVWIGINNPVQTDLQWSLVTFIDLRLRPDGFINTPPTASVVSPQYVIVNQTTQIIIPVSDVNAGDVVRCRWAKYIPGFRRRRQFEGEQEDEHSNNNYPSLIYQKASKIEEQILVRHKRAKCKRSCNTVCNKDCSCTCPSCLGTTCSGGSCKTNPSCPTIPTTTETPGTIKTTSTFPTRQAIDECGGICYPDGVPNATTLSNCTISFTGPIADTWYAVALQIEDFISSTSLTPMSSVPVQFLIYVMSEQICGLAPVILPLQGCFDAQVGVSISFNVSAMTLCSPNVSDIDVITITSAPTGVNVSDTVNSSNASISYATFTWIPLADQLGPQQLCFVAFSDETIQSEQYCVTFNVITYLANCIPTTTTTSTTTSTTTTSDTTIITTMATTASQTTTEASPLNTTSIAIISVLGFLLLTLCIALGLYWLCRKLAQKRSQKSPTKEKYQEEPTMMNNEAYKAPSNRFYYPYYGMHMPQPQYRFMNSIIPFHSPQIWSTPRLPRSERIVMISVKK